jgi:hypothetical protein
MNAENIVVVAAIVIALWLAAARLGLSPRRRPLAVLVLAAIGVAAWAVSFERDLTRSLIWPYAAAWLVTAGAAAGFLRWMALALGAAAGVTGPERPTRGDEA